MHKIVHFRCPSTGAYIDPCTSSGMEIGAMLGPSERQFLVDTSTFGRALESGCGLVSDGDILVYNRGQHTQIPGGPFFIKDSEIFAIIRDGVPVPLPDRTERVGNSSRKMLQFHELKGFSSEDASKCKPANHFIIEPEKIDSGGRVIVPETAGRYNPRDNYGGDNRPSKGIVLSVPLVPIGRDGFPFDGRIPAVGDTVWFSTIAWAGGTTSSDPFCKSGRIVDRWPGMMPLIDIHMGISPGGDMYAVGDYGICAQETHADGFLEGRNVIGSGKFVMGGDGWERIHGQIGRGTQISFRVTQGRNGGNTVAPSPWGWCVRVMASNLTGVEVAP